MSENKNSVLPDVIEPISNAIQQNIPETAKQTDEALSTVVGFFNNVVLYHVKKANLTFRYKLEAFEDDLKEKTKHIPPENLQIPPTMIAGPTLEALRYAYDEETLREMYENLLASAMDNRIASKTHPAFVDTIKQMTPIEAKIIEVLAQNGYPLKCAEITFNIPNTTMHYGKAMPEHFVEEFYELGDPFVVSSSITNLARLGIVRVTIMGVTGQNYNSFKTHPYVLSRKSLFETFGREFQIDVSKHALMLNDYGKQFVKICLGKEV